MPEPVTRWKAKNGSVHDTFEDAIVCDLAAVLGKIGNGDNSMTPAIARQIVEKGDAIRDLLAALEKHQLSEMIVAAEMRPRIFENPRDAAAGTIVAAHVTAEAA